MNPVQMLFPKWAAAGTQTQVHGEQAYVFARAAAKAPDLPTRLDAAVRAYNSFDHAITASQSLPLKWLTTDVGKYYVGYQAAKAAATLLVGSGLIPGARERVGKQELVAAREYFHQGIDGYRAGGMSRYNRYLAGDFLGASIEDTATGLFMLRKPDVARPLLQGLLGARHAVSARYEIPESTVREIDSLFKRASASLDELIAAAQAAAPQVVGTR